MEQAGSPGSPNGDHQDIRNGSHGRIGQVGRHTERGSQNSSGNGNGQPRAATGSQLRALNAIASRLDLDLEDECHHEFGCRPKELNVRQASQMIDDLKARQNGESEHQPANGRRGGGRR